MSKKTYIFLSFILFLFTACDSGDIYPTNDDDNENSSVTAEFLLLGLDTYPQNYLLIFGAFGDDSTPITSTSVTKPQEGEPVKVSLSNIPEDATHVKLCLSTLGRQTIYTFFEQEISNTSNTLNIPQTEINLLQYERIQQQIFELGTCASCHGITSGAAGLKLGESVSYANLVNVESKKSDKLRVAPNDVAQSFLIDVLTSTETGLSHPHTTILSKKEDIDLLKTWIENGAKN